MDKALIDTASGAVLRIGPSAIFEGEDLTGKTLADWTGGDAERLAKCTFDAGASAFSVDVTAAREDRKAALAAYRDDVVLATVQTDFGTFYTDDKSKLLMAGKLLGLLLAERLGQPVPETVTFKTVAGFETFATGDFMVAALQLLGGIETAFGTQETLEATIDALSDPAAILAVAWPE